MVTLNCTDRIRLIDFPPNVIVVVRELIVTQWPRGLQDENVLNVRFYCVEHILRSIHSNLQSTKVDANGGETVLKHADK